MKIGFKSRLWGPQISNLPKVLDLIADAGYDGVEFSQRPDGLGCTNLDELLSMLAERNLTLLSLTCGSINERLSFLKDYKPSYLSIRHSDISRVPELVKDGHVPAIHPGVFSPIRRFSDMLILLEEYPSIKFLCDMAHITIAGDNPIDVTHRLKDSIAAIHFKDWTPEFGRSGPRYSRGFTDLGKGIVKLKQTLTQLETESFQGWLVAEVENIHQDEISTLYAATKWFSDEGLIKSQLKKSSELSPLVSINHHPVNNSNLAEAKFRERVLISTTKNQEYFYQFLAKAIEDLTRCDQLTIWAVSPSQEQMGLLYSSVPVIVTPERDLVIKTSESLSGISIERQASSTRFDLTIEQPGGDYGFPARRLERSDITHGTLPKQMTSIPIYNSDHRNYVRLIVNLFHHHNQDFDMTENQIYWCSHVIATASDIMLDKLCSLAATRVNLIAGQSEDTNVFLENLKTLIQTNLSCDGVAIFLVNEGGDKLELRDSTGTNWLADPKERYYKKGEGLTGKVWERSEALLSVNSLVERGHRGKSEEKVDLMKEHACIWAPIVNSQGNVMGVIRCRNKKKGSRAITPNMFTDDDASILDAIGQAVVPHLQILLEKERRFRALGRLTHELKVPLVAIRGAAEHILRSKGVENFFDYDYPGDIWSWSELMRRLIGNADLFRYSTGTLPIQPTPTLIQADIIAPVVKQVRFLLEERGFNARSIVYGSFERIPKLWIDRNQFQQVMFNLIANSIKHCYADPTSFQVDIDGTKEGEYYVIRVRDWGPGIVSEMKEAVFEEGIRTSDAIHRNITGQGLGLWVVNEIIKRHGGSVSVTSLVQPTEFSIFLPTKLSKRSTYETSQRRSK